MSQQEALPDDIPLKAFSLAGLDKAVEGLTQKVALVAVVAVMLIAFANVTEIILRNFFHVSLYGLNEINVLLVAIAVSTCLPSGMSRRSALSIDVLASRFSKRSGLWMRAFGAGCFALFLALLAWRLGVSSHQMALGNQTTIMTDIPKAPFFWAVTVAIAIATVVQLIVTLRVGFDAVALTPRFGLSILALGIAGFVVLFLMIDGIVSAKAFNFLVPSNPLIFATLMFALMWVAIMLTVPLGAAMGIFGLIGTAVLLGNAPALEVLGAESRSYITRDALSVLPLFLLMGTFASVAGIGSDLYRLAYALLGHLRGGLAHASILACAGFGTLTGSSIATQMTIGRIAMPEMRSRGYSAELSAGSIAAGGTLGQLIPPSTALIFYAVMTEQSVGQLFVGAIIPGILATLLYMATVAAWLIFFPDHAPKGQRSSLMEIARVMKDCWAVVLLLALVLGGIYTGLFTELEAGSVGAAGALILAITRGKINRGSIWRVMGETTSTMAMMYSLLFGTLMLSFFFGIAHLPDAFLAFVDSFHLPPLGVIIALVLCYLILGTALDSWAMMVITIPLFVPLVTSLGYDPIWWGLMTIICMEAGQISPPFGINIFMISSISPDIPLMRVYRGCWPFFFSTLVKIILLIAFPALVTWLPTTM